jgi:hypothetical protein
VLVSDPSPKEHAVMAWIWKRHAGTDPWGHVWPENGSVVEIDDHWQIKELLAIPDGGFFEVPPPAGQAQAADDAESGDDAPAKSTRGKKAAAS